MWLHTKKPTAFGLVVDDVAVKYVTDADAHHLRNAILRKYEITTDCGGTVSYGITFKWDCGKRTCDMSMPGYISNVLNKCQHDNPKTQKHTPIKYVTPVYGAKMQYATQDETPLLSAKKCTIIQNITGSVLYYSRSVDPTVCMPLNDIATEQTTATEKTQTAASQLLDYLATHPDATIRFYASDMVLHIHIGSAPSNIADNLASASICSSPT
jgi:hypothetical protein